MRVFGFEITRTKAGPALPVSSGSRGWYPLLIREPFTGAWQRNQECRLESVLAHPTVYACITLIASDIAKMRTKLVEERQPNIWTEVESPSYSPVLRRPNHYQNHTQFRKWWMISKLAHGNTYVLKRRDDRGGIGQGNVRSMVILDPTRVTVLVSPEGDVFYQLGRDNLVPIEEVTVPASEIIHDRIPLFHPLVGVSPLFAGGGPASTGLTVQQNSLAFFSNGANPSGILSAPGEISQTTADRIKQHWETEYNAGKSGKLAVLGDDLKYTPMTMSAVDSELIDQLKWTAESVCAAFRVPAFMVGAGPVPAHQNTELLTRTYYGTCLHEHVSDMEAALDEGLGLEENKEGRRLGIELDKAALLQMDTATQYRTLGEGIRGGFLAPNEARATIDLMPLKGGDTVYLQHQDYPIEMLADRAPPDAPGAAAGPAPESEPAEPESDTAERQITAVRLKAISFRVKTATSDRAA